MSILSKIHAVFKRETTTVTGGSLKNYDAAFWYDFLNIDNGNIVTVTAQSSLSFSAVYSVVDRIVKTLAYLPLKIYKKNGNDRVLATDHDQYYLLSQSPSALYSSFNFRRAIFANYLLQGDGYAKIIRHPQTNRPVAYELQASQDWEVFLDNSSKKYPFIYYYNRKTNEIVFQEDMIHISDLNFNGLKGLSKIQLHKDNIGFGLSATKMGKKIMENGNFLGGYLKYPQTLDIKQLEKYRKSFLSTYHGMQHAGKIAALDGGSEFVPLKYNMPLSDAEYIQNREFQIDDICRIFDYPIELMKSSSSNSSNFLEQVMINYVQSNLTPIATMLEQELNRKIFRISEKGTYYTKLELKGLLRGDIKSRTEFYKTMFSSSAMNANEIRAAEDMKPIPNGDKYYIPVNNLIPIDKIDEYIQSIIDSKTKKISDGK